MGGTTPPKLQITANRVTISFLPSLVIETAPLSTGCALTLKWKKRGINDTAHVNHQQRDAKTIRRHKQAVSRR
jgi:hypothetical protein